MELPEILVNLLNTMPYSIRTQILVYLLESDTTAGRNTGHFVRAAIGKWLVANREWALNTLLTHLIGPRDSQFPRTIREWVIEFDQDGVTGDEWVREQRKLHVHGAHER